MQRVEVLPGLDFSFLDQMDFRVRYASGPAKNQIRFFVGGIQCSKCVRKLEDLSLTIPGLKSLRVEFGKSLATAEIDSKILSFSELANKISALGFKPVPVPPDFNEEDAERRENRSELIRLGIAAACAGNIMTFSFATYLGAPTSFQSLFFWLGFVLYLPVVTFVAWPFYVGAWNSILRRQLSIDLPMAVASMFGFIFSTVELLRGREDVYFDSLSGFLFLILLSRWGQRRLQRLFLRPQELLESLELSRVRHVHESGWSWKPLELVQPGEQILLHAGETLAAESELLSESAHFNLAWLSGESKPRIFLRGAVVPAGARLSATKAEFKVKTLLSDTSFGQILEEVERFALSKTRLVTLADRAAQWLLGIVFLIALVFLATYWQHSSEEAIRRALALIILACPCAMAFGTPLALSAALRRARQNGLVIRSANVFEKATQIRTIFFDKTGTLTESDLSLQENPLSIPKVYQNIILSLENESMHPIAFALRKAFQTPDRLEPVEARREIAGLGVAGFICGKFYEIKQNAKAGLNISCTLFEDHNPLFDLTFTSQIKPECFELLPKLRESGYRLFLLSGDKKDVVKSTASQLGFAESEIYAEVDPFEKALIVSKTPDAMMVGDGVNDSLAMMRAKVALAVSGGMQVALRSSDVYLTNASLKGISSLLDLSRDSLYLIRQNLFISVLYNSIAGCLALMGYINPFVAALLMPVSSGFILLSTWIRGKSR
jgi:Cu2+-exporting ATPase/Cu+-exporting ATPase